MNSKLMKLSPARSLAVRMSVLVLTLLGLLGGLAPTPVAQAAAPAAPAATYDAYLECWVEMPYEVYIDQEFKIKVYVDNYSDYKAKKVKVYGHATPSGDFDVDGSTTASLGKIKAWGSKTAKYHVTAPDEPGWYTFEFYAEAHNAEDAYCGSYDIEVKDDTKFLIPE